jgi:hypothetical protein
MKRYIISYHKASATIGYKVYKAQDEERAVQKFRRYSSAAILRVEKVEEGE